MTTHLALFLMLLVPACGYGPSVQLACSDLAVARCDKRAACSNGSDVARVYGDRQTCLERERLSCTLSLAQPGAPTPLSVEACVVAFAGLGCVDFYSGILPDACLAEGRNADGAPCSFGVQCQSGFCAGNKTSLCGVCSAQPPVTSPCTSSNCGRGQVCVLRTQICQSVPALGMPCDSTTLPCGPKLSCIGNTDGKMGTCADAVMDLGAACGGTLSGCDLTSGMSCAGVTPVHVCTQVGYATDGMPCGALPNGTTAFCAGSGACFAGSMLAPIGSAGVCKGAAPDGAACDSVLGPPCLSPARCVSPDSGSAGTCTLPSVTCH